MNAELNMAVVLAEPHHSYNSSLGLSPDPNSIIWMPSPSEHVPRYDIPGVNLPHLSPGSTYQRGSSQDTLIDMGTPPHQSPHHGYAEEGCTNLMYADFNTACEMINQYHTGERSPDSGSEFPLRQSVIRSKVYSPQCHSPPTNVNDFDALAISDGTLASSLCDTSDYMRAIPHYSTANHPPPLYPSMNLPTSCSLSYNDLPMFVRHGEQPFIDGSIDHTGAMPIVPHDQSNGPPPMNNPIHFYPECTSEMPVQFIEPHHSSSPPCVYTPSNFTEEFQRPQPPPIRHAKRPRKAKAPATVDPSEIKDIPASAQLWEFLLKVLKKPKYSYMVSWENQQDGLFRFHDPPAFAALWGRHRNRPSMTYDKVARALRYYYRRDILEQVGGRLTYKFSSRLCKQFTTKVKSTVENTNTTSSQKED